MKGMLLKARWVGAASIISLTWVNSAFAQVNGQSITLTNPLSGQTFSQVVTNVISFIFWDVATPLCTLMVLVGGFQMITSAGNPEKTAQGRKTILYAAIGFGVVLLATGITSLIQSILTNQ